MSEQKYNLFITGLNDNVDYGKYNDNIAEFLQIDRVFLKRIFNNIEASYTESYELAKSNISMEIAQKYQTALKKIGISCKIEQGLELDLSMDIVEVKSFTCPVCKFEQEVDDDEEEICKRCGVVKEKYLEKVKEQKRLETIRQNEKTRIKEEQHQIRRDQEIKNKVAEENEIRQKVRKKYSVRSKKNFSNPIFIGLVGLLVCTAFFGYKYTTKDSSRNSDHVTVPDVNLMVNPQKIAQKMMIKQNVVEIDTGSVEGDIAAYQAAMNNVSKKISAISSFPGPDQRTVQRIKTRYEQAASTNTVFTKNDYQEVMADINEIEDEQVSSGMMRHLTKQAVTADFIASTAVDDLPVSTSTAEKTKVNKKLETLHEQFPEFEPAVGTSQASTVAFMLQELISDKPPSKADKNIYLKILTRYDAIAAGKILFNRETYLELVKEIKTVENFKIRQVLYQQVAVQALDENVVDFIGLGVSDEHKVKIIPEELQTTMKPVIQKGDYVAVSAELTQIKDPYAKIYFLTDLLKNQTGRENSKGNKIIKDIESLIMENATPVEQNALMRGMLSNALTLLKKTKPAELAIRDSLKTVKSITDDDLKIKVLNNLALDQIKYKNFTSAYYFLEYGRRLLPPKNKGLKDPDMAYGVLASGFAHICDLQTANSLAEKITHPLRRKRVLLSVKKIGDKLYNGDENFPQAMPSNPFDTEQ